jgi:hypothetical protein
MVRRHRLGAALARCAPSHVVSHTAGPWTTPLVIAFPPGVGTDAAAWLIAGPMGWSLGTEEPA